MMVPASIICEVGNREYQGGGLKDCACCCVPVFNHSIASFLSVSCLLHAYRAAKVPYLSSHCPATSGLHQPVSSTVPCPHPTPLLLWTAPIPSPHSPGITACTDFQVSLLTPHVSHVKICNGFGMVPYTEIFALELSPRTL